MSLKTNSDGSVTYILDENITQVPDRQESEIVSLCYHHTVTDQPDNLKLLNSINENHKARLHNKPNGYGNHVAYHAIIDREGLIMRTRPITEFGWHCSEYEQNITSIGVALEGYFDVSEPTDAQMQSLAKYIKEIRTYLGNDIAVHAHNEFAAKTCPGENFDHNKLQSLLQDEAGFYEAVYKEEGYEEDIDKAFKDVTGAVERISKIAPDEMKPAISALVHLIATINGRVNRKISQ